jgi:hypothetical protein
MKISKEQLKAVIKEEVIKENLTRQTFQLIADVLRANKDHGNWETIVNDFAARLANTNPKFDEIRFLAACGMRIGGLTDEDFHARPAPTTSPARTVRPRVPPRPRNNLR